MHPRQARHRCIARFGRTVMGRRPKMDGMGTADAGVLLVRLAWLGALASTLGAFASFWGRRAGLRRWPTGIARVTRTWASVCLAGAVIGLAWAFHRVDATLVEVVSASQRGRPAWERVAGLWGSSRSSLLLWAAFVAVAVTVSLSAAGGPRQPAGRGAELAGSLLILTLATLLLTSASPFRRLPTPAIDGRGLLPILRHPAMAVHPPLLYAAQALMIAAAIRPNRWRPHIPLAVGITALTLGAGWAYAELGWGGFWAWDPVENAGLLPCLALLAAVHAKGRAQRVLVRAAGVLALGGAALTRSGRGISVHSFAPNRSVGIVLGLLVAGATVAAVWASWTERRRGTRKERGGVVGIETDDEAVPKCRWSGTGASDLTVATDWRIGPRRVIVGLAVAVLAIVVVGTAVPLLAPDRTITGAFFARLSAPGAVLGLMLLILRRPSAARVAHVGALVLAIGIAGSAFGRDGRAWLRPGQSGRIAGRNVMLVAIDATVPKAQARGFEERVKLVVDRHLITPRADRWVGWVDPLAETASRRVGITDVQTVLRQVLTPTTGPSAALIEVHARPLLALVWLGGALLALGSLTSRPLLSPLSPLPRPKLPPKTPNRLLGNNFGREGLPRMQTRVTKPVDAIAKTDTVRLD